MPLFGVKPIPKANFFVSLIPIWRVCPMGIFIFPIWTMKLGEPGIYFNGRLFLNPGEPW
jgi:hypothetical protein